MEPNIKLCVGSPTNFSEAECDAFIEFVVKAGKIATNPIRILVPNAAALGMLFCGARIIGSAALKRPNETYQKRIFNRAKAQLPANYPFELGWVHVDKSHQRNGHAKKLASAVLDHANDKGIYATTSSDAMSKILCSLNFVESGNPYESNDGEEDLSLFIRPT